MLHLVSLFEFHLHGQHFTKPSLWEMCDIKRGFGSKHHCADFIYIGIGERKCGIGLSLLFTSPVNVDWGCSRTGGSLKLFG